MNVTMKTHLMSKYVEEIRDVEAPLAMMPIYSKNGATWVSNIEKNSLKK